VKILVCGTIKELKVKLMNQMVWGMQAGRIHFWVYVDKKYPREKVEKARDELERIKRRGPYHTEGDRMWPEYEKHKGLPLSAPSETLLAEVLHKVGILQQATVPALHQLLKPRGRLFGVDDDPHFRLYLHKRYDQQVVVKARELLQAALSSATPMDTENRR
jgi:hypothetical protein